MGFPGEAMLAFKPHAYAYSKQDMSQLHDKLPQGNESSMQYI